MLAGILSISKVIVVAAVPAASIASCKDVLLVSSAVTVTSSAAAGAERNALGARLIAQAISTAAKIEASNTQKHFLLVVNIFYLRFNFLLLCAPFSASAAFACGAKIFYAH